MGNCRRIEIWLLLVHVLGFGGEDLHFWSWLLCSMFKICSAAFAHLSVIWRMVWGDSRLHPRTASLMSVSRFTLDVPGLLSRWVWKSTNVTSALHNQSSQQWQSVASTGYIVSGYKTLRSCPPKSESRPGSSLRWSTLSSIWKTWIGRVVRCWVHHGHSTLSGWRNNRENLSRGMHNRPYVTLTSTGDASSLVSSHFFTLCCHSFIRL